MLFRSHRCYMTECGIPVIQLGQGGVIISDLFFEDNQCAGVGFSLGAGEVGQDHPELEGELANEIGVFMQIVSTTPESLQILIDRLKNVKSEWEARLESSGDKQ